MPTYEIAAPDGKTYSIDGPEGATKDQVIAAILAKNPAAGMPPSKERTWGESATDVGAGLVGGLGSLVQLPGQVYGLATGDMSKTGALGLGEGISQYAEEMKSAGLKAREAERARKIAESAKEGQLSAFGTALGETVKDPGLLLSFLAEQAPQLLIPFGAARGVGAVAKGLGAAEAAAGKAAVSGAVGAGAVQQGADIGAGAYEDIYKELIRKGATEPQAAEGALTLARQAGAAAGVISLLAQRLPGARQLEEALAGVPGKSAAGLVGRLKMAGSTAAGETLGEIPEEVGGKFAQNLAMQQVKPEQSLTEGLGETAAMATLGAVGMGGASGLARGRASPEVTTPAPEQPATQPELQQRIESATGVTRPTEEQQPMLSSEEAGRQRLVMLQEKIDEEAKALKEKAAREGPRPVVPEEPIADRSKPSLNETQMPVATSRETLEAKQAEIDRLRLEAGLPTGQSSKTPGVQPVTPVAEDVPVPKIVDNRPLQERAAQNRLLVMQNMLKNEGGDPNSLTIVPHPSIEGRFAIQSLDVPTKFGELTGAKNETGRARETTVTRLDETGKPYTEKTGTPSGPGIVIDPVNNYIEVARKTNTPASMRLVRDFEAGIVTRPDIEAAIDAEKKAGMPLPLNYRGNGEPWFIAPEVSKPRGNIPLPISATLKPLVEGPEKPPVTKTATQVYGEMEPPKPGTSGRPPVIEPPVETPTVEVEPPTPSTEMPKTLAEFKARMPLSFNNPEIRQANNEGNFAKLADILSRSTNPAIRRIGELALGVSTKIKLKKPRFIGEDVAGVFRYADDSIQMDPMFAGDEHTNAHETLHGLVSRAQRFPTDRQKPTADKIVKLYEHVKKEMLRTGKARYARDSKGRRFITVYGLTNEREFTAEAMTNPEFQFELMQIPYGGRKSAWTAFTQLVAELLGIKNTNALTEVMNLVDRLAQTKQPKGVKVDKGEVDYAETYTPEFKRWFGDSKIVDKNGNPLVVYHGTKKDFTAFKTGYGDGLFFFSTSPEFASKWPVGTGGLREVSQENQEEYKRMRDLDASLREKYMKENYDFDTEEGIAKYDADRKKVKDELRKQTGYESPTVFENNAGIRVMPLYLSIQKPFDPRTDYKKIEPLLRKVGKGNLIEGDYHKSGNWVVYENAEVIQELKRLGYDGIWLAENVGGPHETIAAFSNKQIKSATGNQGTYDPESEEIDRMEMPKSVGEVKQKVSTFLQKNKPITAETMPGITTQFTEAANRIFKPQSTTIVEKVTNMQDRFWQRLAQGIADQYRTIKDYSPTGYIQARLSKTVDGALEGIMFHGHVFNDGGALNIKSNTKGLIESMKPLGNEVDRYQMWVALNRESNLPIEKRSRSEDMDYMVANRDQLIEGTVNGKPRSEAYAAVLKDMNALNRSVLDVALEVGLIDQKGYDNFSRDIYYIPFYRQMENGDLQGAQTSAGLTRQQFSKALKGAGERPFGDLMENTLRNWSHILSASMKNQAAVTTIKDAEQLGAVEKVKESDTDTVKIMVEGRPEYYSIKDPLLLESITSIGYMGPQSKYLDVARKFKNMLQYGVTMAPPFKVNNLFRDSTQAMAVSDLEKNPWNNVVRGWMDSDRNNPAHISALAGGAIFNFGSAYEGNQSKLVKKLIEKGVKESDILDTPEKIKQGLSKLWEKYEEFGNKSEAANRMALYNQLREKGYSHFQASYEARDLMDFSMQGSWVAFRYLTQVVPFMNARIQGLYKLGRDGVLPTARVLYNSATGKELDLNDKKKAQAFSIVSAAVCLASLALYYGFKDDEEFQKRDNWDRDNFWWIKLPGMDAAMRIPKPFEIGALGTIAERTAEQIFDADSEGKQFTDALSRMIFDTFALNPMPQIFKPLVNLYANKDSFTGSPIETAGMEALSKAERKSENTSPLAIALSGMSSVLGEKGELSPVQVDYAIRAYFGWIGGTVASASMYATMPFKEGEAPDTNWMDKASLGFVKTLPANQSRYTTAFYENNKQITEAFADMRHYREINDMDGVQRIMEEKGDKIALEKIYIHASKQMANLRKQIRAISEDKYMDGATKKEEINRKKELISMIAKQAEDTRKASR